ncbi:MAG: hypothetical protein OXN96_22295 [Bryobacterales bacterium]|nr:hypothetical protein [Bryobacterales bacterium]
MRLRLCILAALPGCILSAESLPHADIEAWVLDMGGAVERNSAGDLQTIDLSRSWVTDADLRSLEGAASLASLKLAQTHVSDSVLEVVASLPALRELDLFFCEHITDAGASLLRQASLLERLNLRGTKISDSGVRFLTEIKTLEVLDIGITEISDASVGLLEALPNLEGLAIGGNKIGEPGITSLRSLRQLQHLDLSGAQVTDSGVWAVTVTDLNLDEIAGLQRLESLNLAAPSPEYVEAISTGVPRLRGAIRITDFGAKQLAALSKLRKLNLSRSLLTSEGIQNLRGLDDLEEVVLSHSRSLDDSAGTALASLPSLQVVDVSFTAFGDSSIAALREHPSLRRLIAVGTAVTEAAASEFTAANPAREVIR